MARPVVPLLHLVQNRRFDARNKRHRAKPLNDDSLLEFVAYHEGASVRLQLAAEAQERYRQTHARAAASSCGGRRRWRRAAAASVTTGSRSSDRWCCNREALANR
jgi:hypothetical protein